MAFAKAGIFEGRITSVVWSKPTKDGFPGIAIDVEADGELDHEGNLFQSSGSGAVWLYLCYIERKTGSVVPNDISLKQIAEVIPGFDLELRDEICLPAFQSAIGSRVRVNVAQNEYNGQISFKIKEIHGTDWAGSTSAAGNPDDVAKAKRLAKDILASSPVKMKPLSTVSPVAKIGRAKLHEILTDMHKRGEDWKVVTGGKKIAELSDSEVDEILNRLQFGPDLTPPKDDIPF